jgi:hypothetical protein
MRLRDRSKTRANASTYFVADLFEQTSPFAETSPDAGSECDWPASLQHHCCAVFSSDGKTIDARAVAQVLCAA